MECPCILYPNHSHSFALLIFLLTLWYVIKHHNYLKLCNYKNLLSHDDSAPWADRHSCCISVSCGVWDNLPGTGAPKWHPSVLLLFHLLLLKWLRMAGFLFLHFLVNCHLGPLCFQRLSFSEVSRLLYDDCLLREGNRTVRPL